jgi:hypothetical protein
MAGQRCLVGALLGEQRHPLQSCFSLFVSSFLFWVCVCPASCFVCPASSPVVSLVPLSFGSLLQFVVCV